MGMAVVAIGGFAQTHRFCEPGSSGVSHHSHTDQRITVTVELPKRISDPERELLERLAGHHSARGKQHHHHNSGLFARLFGQK